MLISKMGKKVKQMSRIVMRMNKKKLIQIHHQMFLYSVIVMKKQLKRENNQMKNKLKRKVAYVNTTDFQKKKENRKLRKRKEKREKQNCQKISKKFLQKNKDELMYIS